MSRQYINIRLSYEAKYFIEIIQENMQRKLDYNIKNDMIEEIERHVCEHDEFRKKLDGHLYTNTNRGVADKLTNLITVKQDDKIKRKLVSNQYIKRGN